MILVKIAWRNIWRHPGRSFTIIGSVTLGIWAILFLTSIYEGMIRQRVKDVISIETAHIQFHHPRFLPDYEPQYVIPDASALIKDLQKDKRVSFFAERRLVTAMINSSGGSFGVVVVGVRPNQERTVSELQSKLLAGDFLTDSSKIQVVVGAKLAERLRLKLRSKVVVTCQSVNGEIVSGVFRVSGIYKTNNEPFDESHVYVYGDHLAEMIGAQSELHEIAVLLKDQDQINEVMEQYAAKWNLIEVKSWMDISPEMKLLIGFFDEYMTVFMLIVFLAVAFGIVNTMLMSVLERTRELGMMFAIGMNKRKIFGMITMETVLLMLAGLPAGLISGLVTVWYFGKQGVDFGSSEVMANFGFGDVLYPAITYQQVLTTVSFILIITMISSVYPSVRAILIKPFEAIRK
jgi:putative ABC transport system permease protein